MPREASGVGVAVPVPAGCAVTAAGGTATAGVRNERLADHCPQPRGFWLGESGLLRICHVYCVLGAKGSGGEPRSRLGAAIQVIGEPPSAFSTKIWVKPSGFQRNSGDSPSTTAPSVGVSGWLSAKTAGTGAVSPEGNEARNAMTPARARRSDRLTAERPHRSIVRRRGGGGRKDQSPMSTLPSRLLRTNRRQIITWLDDFVQSPAVARRTVKLSLQ